MMPELKIVDGAMGDEAALDPVAAIVASVTVPASYAEAKNLHRRLQIESATILSDMQAARHSTDQPFAIDHTIERLAVQQRRNGEELRDAGIALAKAREAHGTRLRAALRQLSLSQFDALEMHLAAAQNALHVLNQIEDAAGRIGAERLPRWSLNGGVEPLLQRVARHRRG
jgi:hypothetical protein